MKRPELDAVRAQIRARMEAGELMTWKDVWRATDVGSRAWAHETLKNWHRAELVHIVSYKRATDGGAPLPTFAWGAGKDAKRPTPLSVAKRCAKWRKRNPETAERSKRADVFKRRKTPILDPIIGALLGYRRLGSGWVKRKPPTTGQP